MRIRIIVGALAVLVGCAPAPPQPADASVDAPEEVTSGRIAIEWAGDSGTALIVPVFINEQGPYSFVLDTGATLTCIDTALARELDLPARPGQVGAVGLGGSGRVQLVRIDSLQVGDAAANNLPACAIDLGVTKQVGFQLDGLLGLNFLRDYHLAIDFDAGHVTLSSP